MKRFNMSIVAAIVVATSTIIIPDAFALPTSLEKKTIENLGNNLVSDFVSEDGYILTKNNKDEPILIVIAKGEKGEYNFVNLKTGQNIKHGVANPDIDKTVRSWAGTVVEDGTVYLTDNNGFVYKADPNTLSFEVLPKPGFIKGEFAFWDAVTGDNGWLYFAASYPSGGRIVGYNHNTKEWKDFGVIYPGAIYVRSIAYDNGKIYAGTGSGKFTETFEIEANNPQNKIKLPRQDVYPEANTPGNSFMLTAHDGYLYIGHAGTNLGGHYVWDIKNKKYVDLIPNSGDNAIKSRIISSPIDNSIVYNGKDNNLYKYDPVSKKTILLSDSKSSLPINKTSFIDDNHIVGFNKNNGDIQIRNIKDNTVNTLKNDNNQLLYPTVTMINALGNGVKDHVLVGGAGGSSMWNIDDTLSKQQIIDKNHLSLIKQRNQETTTINRVGDNVVYTQYPNAVMMRIKNSDGDFDALGLGSQDKLSLMRPLSSLPLDDNRIAIASTPNYGEYTGAITIYNASTNKIENNYQVNGLIPTSIAFDGKNTIYASTSVKGEHADKNNRPEDSAYILKINIETQEIEKYQPFNKDTKVISAVSFDDKGRLFAYSADTLMELDPKDLTIIKQHDFGEHKIAWYTDTLTYSPQHEGFIAVMNNIVYWIDPDDITHRDKLDDGKKIVIADSGNIYYNKNNKVHRIIPYSETESTTDIESSTIISSSRDDEPTKNSTSTNPTTSSNSSSNNEPTTTSSINNETIITSTNNISDKEPTTTTSNIEDIPTTIINNDEKNTKDEETVSVEKEKNIIQQDTRKDIPVNTSRRTQDFIPVQKVSPNNYSRSIDSQVKPVNDNKTIAIKADTGSPTTSILNKIRTIF